MTHDDETAQARSKVPVGKFRVARTTAIGPSAGYEHKYLWLRRF